MSLESERYLLATQHDGDSDQKGSQRQAVANCVQETKLVPVGLSKKKRSIVPLYYCTVTKQMHCTTVQYCTAVPLYYCTTVLHCLTA